MINSGIILINKNYGVSSNKVLQYIKHFYGIKKIGFSGTLDPFATGLLVILVGQATKISNSLTGLGKSYIYTIKTGIKTDSLDITGNILAKEDYSKYYIWDSKTILKSTSYFHQRTYQQIIPMYSAMKYKGKPLYKYARDKQVINKKFSKKVTIYENNLLYFNKKQNEIKIYTECSKGTFIRSIAQDICARLDIIGCVKQLKRIQVGPFHINDAWDYYNLPNKLENALISIRNVITLLKYKIINYNDNISCDNIRKYIFINNNKKYIFGFYKGQIRSIYEKVEYKRYIYKCIKRFEK